MKIFSNKAEKNDNTVATFVTEDLYYKQQPVVFQYRRFDSIRSQLRVVGFQSIGVFYRKIIVLTLLNDNV